MEPGVADQKPMTKPKIWHYLVAFIILALLWILLLEVVIRPDLVVLPGLSAVGRMAIYFLPPLLLVGMAFVARSIYVERKMHQQEEAAASAKAEEARRLEEEQVREEARTARKRFTLHVLGVSAAVEYLQQAEILEEMAGGDPYTGVLSEEPEDYPTTVEEKEKASREREVGGLDQVLGWLNDEWAIPAFLVGPELQNPQMMDVLESNLLEALDLGEQGGRRLKVVETLFDDRPDHVVQKVFDFMDQHPEVPAVLLVAEDGMVLRHSLRAEDSPDLVYDGPRPRDAASETLVALLLGRKDRIEPMRAFVMGDVSSEDPMTPYWEKEQQEQALGAFQTTEWMPTAWSSDLIEAFRELPVVGELHRPQYVAYPGTSGNGSQSDAFKERWLEALENLGASPEMPALFLDHGPVTMGRKMTPMTRALSGLDPDFNVFEASVNLHRRLGDAGACAPVLGLALAALACQAENKPAASVFLRREDGSSIFLVKPFEEKAVPPAELAEA